MSKYMNDKEDIIPGTNIRITREPEIKNCYDIHRKLGNELYGSSKDLLKRNLFGGMEQYVIRRCGYSYSFINLKDKSLKHDVIWINPKYMENWGKYRIEDTIRRDMKYIDREIIKIWENEMYLRSVPSIKHYHILSILK